MNTKGAGRIKPAISAGLSGRDGSLDSGCRRRSDDRTSANEPRQSAARRLDRAVRRAAARRDQAGAFPRPPSSRRWPAHRAEIDADRRRSGGAGFRQHRGGAGALRAAARPRLSSVFYVLAGAHTSERDPGDRARHGAEARPPLERDPPERGAVRPASMRCTARRDASALRAEQARVLERYHALFRRAGAGLDARREGAAEGDRRAARERSAPHSARTCSPTSSPTCCRSPRTISPACRTSRARRRAAPREERGLDGPYAVTLGRSSVEPFLQFSARRDLREKAFRAWIARGDNGGATDNNGDHRRADRAARRAGAAARLSELRRTTSSTTPWRRRRTAVTGLLDAVWAPARRRVGRGARRPAGDGRGRGRQLPPRAVGLALLRREAAQGALRSRRERDQAVPAARAHHRGGVLHGEPAVRADLHAAHATCRSIIRTCASGR